MPHNIIHRLMWENLKGYNEFFSPGMSSDNDLRIKMVSKSRVYHFQCKSTTNDGRKQFSELYGMSAKTFNTFFLRKENRLEACCAHHQLPILVTDQTVFICIVTLRFMYLYDYVIRHSSTGS